MLGKSLTRETLVENYHVLALAIKYIGTRVSVPTCQIHLGHLYDWMDISCPSNSTHWKIPVDDSI